MASTQQNQEVSGVEDPTDYKQRHRIKSMLEARDMVLEQRRRAKDLYISGEIDETLTKSMLRDAIEGYIYESEQKIREYLPDDDEDEEDFDDQASVSKWVWEECDLGEIQTETGPIGFTGISSIVEAPSTIKVSWTEEEDHHMEGRRKTRYTETYEIPMSVSMEAFRALNRFWNEMGMDIEMKHKLPVDKVGYEQ